MEGGESSVHEFRIFWGFRAYLGLLYPFEGPNWAYLRGFWAYLLGFWAHLRGFQVCFGPIWWAFGTIWRAVGHFRGSRPEFGPFQGALVAWVLAHFWGFWPWFGPFPGGLELESFQLVGSWFYSTNTCSVDWVNLEYLCNRRIHVGFSALGLEWKNWELFFCPWWLFFVMLHITSPGEL